MASNQVQDYRNKRDAYDNAAKSGVKGDTLATLKAQAEAAKALTPGGKGGGSGIFD